MSTRALIGKINEDGTIITIYNHSDGYVEHLGCVLNENITAENIDEIFKLGYISYVGTKEEISELATSYSTKKGSLAKRMKAYYDSFIDIPNTNLCYSSANPNENTLCCSSANHNENTVYVYADKKDLNIDLKKYAFGVEYVYLFDTVANKWKYIDVWNSKRIKNLDKAISRLNKEV